LPFSTLGTSSTFVSEESTLKEMRRVIVPINESPHENRVVSVSLNLDSDEEGLKAPRELVLYLDLRI
jgi:hypothetical protein